MMSTEGALVVARAYQNEMIRRFEDARAARAVRKAGPRIARIARRASALRAGSSRRAGE